MITPRIDALTQALDIACDQALLLHRRLVRARLRGGYDRKERKAFERARDMVAFFTRAVERENAHLEMGESMGEIDKSPCNPCKSRGIGGWGGIRTLETLARLPVFKTGAFNHSATHPSKRDQILRGEAAAEQSCFPRLPPAPSLFPCLVDRSARNRHLSY